MMRKRRSAPCLQLSVLDFLAGWCSHSWLPLRLHPVCAHTLSYIHTCSQHTYPSRTTLAPLPASMSMNVIDHDTGAVSATLLQCSMLASVLARNAIGGQAPACVHAQFWMCAAHSSGIYKEAQTSRCRSSHHESWEPYVHQFLSFVLATVA